MKLKLLFVLLFVAQTVVATNTIPAVNNEENRNGHFTITPKTALVYNSTVRDVAMYLLEYIPQEDIDWLCGKISRLRIFDDENGVMNLDIQQAGGRAIVISQFTLFASTKKGNRPSYIRSAGEPIARPMYEKFLATLSAVLGTEVEHGEFGADMKVSLVNDVIQQQTYQFLFMNIIYISIFCRHQQLSIQLVDIWGNT